MQEREQDLSASKAKLDRTQPTQSSLLRVVDTRGTDTRGPNRRIISTIRVYGASTDAIV